MIIKGIIDEDTINYKNISMTIMFPYCTFKCGEMHCQNSALTTQNNISISTIDLIERYLNNPITESIIFQGLEPFDSWGDLLHFVHVLRMHYKCNDMIVIYTGYYKDEILHQINNLSGYKNIIVKYGRYIPNQNSHYDAVLGVNLISDNQYAEQIS